jgi:hypothetical protein
LEATDGSGAKVELVSQSQLAGKDQDGTNDIQSRLHVSSARCHTASNKGTDKMSQAVDYTKSSTANNRVEFVTDDTNIVKSANTDGARLFQDYGVLWNEFGITYIVDGEPTWTYLNPCNARITPPPLPDTLCNDCDLIFSEMFDGGYTYGYNQ